MTPAGWVFMLTSIAFVLALVSFCYYRVLTNSGKRCPSCRTLIRAQADFCAECGTRLSND